LEEYLFGEVGPNFATTGHLSPVDLFTIFIWKANRKKYEARDKIKNRYNQSFEAGTARFASEITASDNPQSKLEAVMSWNFRLPTASAILTVFYPLVFTIYDYRVRSALDIHTNLAARDYSPNLWRQYQEYKNAVIANAPVGLTLRECDHHHWGRSFDQDRIIQAANGRPTKPIS
jgi:hypothetical protein